MARARSRQAPSSTGWDPQQVDVSTCNVFTSMLNGARNELNRNDIVIGSAASQSIIGLMLPALCLRYLFQNEVFPLGRLVQIVGEEGSAKSAFADEMIRWHMTHGGGGVVCENENKDTPDLRASILMWNPLWLNRLNVGPTYSLEEWQRMLTTYLSMAKQLQDEPGGPGRTLPIAFVVDSLMGTSTESELDGIDEAGHASRGFAIAAQLITRYARSIPRGLRDYPFTLIGTNHLKPGTTAQGLPNNTSPGGKSVKFHETFEIEMAKTANHDIRLVDYSGLRVRLIMRKNGLGPPRKAITAQLLWWQEHYEAADGIRTRQATAWDWDHATIELLLSIIAGKSAAATDRGGSTTLGRAVASVVDLQANVAQGTCWSRALRIPQSSPVLFREAGRMLEERQDLLDALYPVLGIIRRRVFRPGDDFKRLKDVAAVESEAASRAAFYTAVENMPVPQVHATEFEPAEVDATEDDEEADDNPDPEMAA